MSASTRGHLGLMESSASIKQDAAAVAVASASQLREHCGMGGGDALDMPLDAAVIRRWKTALVAVAARELADRGVDEPFTYESRVTPCGRTTVPSRYY